MCSQFYRQAVQFEGGPPRATSRSKQEQALLVEGLDPLRRGGGPAVGRSRSLAWAQPLLQPQIGGGRQGFAGPSPGPVGIGKGGDG